VWGENVVWGETFKSDLNVVWGDSVEAIR
jgi:hypothetical protein